jgi:DNA-binding response OmpR family regulator
VPDGNELDVAYSGCAADAALNARGWAPVTLGLPPAPAAVVVVIAVSRAERVRLASLVDEEAPVLMAARVADAVALLGEALEPAEPEPAELEVVVGVTVDSDARLARWGDRSVALAPLEHDLLIRLLGSAGHTLTFEELHRDVWGNDHLGDRSDLASTVKRLRRKLDQLSSPLVIQSVRGVGLRLTEGQPRVSVVETA